MPRSLRLWSAVAAVSLLAACSGQPEDSLNAQCGSMPVYPLTAGDYRVTSVTVEKDGCGLDPEGLVGHPAFVSYPFDSDPTFLTVILQNSRAGNMVPNGGGWQGSLTHNAGQLDGTAGGVSSAGGCKYQPIEHAIGTVDAPDQMTLVVTVLHDGREGCTPAGRSCTTVYSAHIERLPAP